MAEYFRAVVLGGAGNGDQVVALPGTRRFDTWAEAIRWCDENKVAILNRGAAEELARITTDGG